jgi:uncharacterized protein (TIGR03067 family)
MTRLALFGVLTLALTASAQDKKDVPKDLAPFQGTWKVLKIESGGKPLEKDPSGLRFKFEGDRMDVIENEKEKEDSGTIEVNSKKDPAEIDFTGSKMNKIQGIYKFDKDGKFHLCISRGKDAPRPKSFDTAGTRNRLFVLEKAK